MAQTAAQRRKAQREVARKLKTGERILPKEITSKAKAVAGERKDLLNQIDKFKQQAYAGNPRWDEKGSKKASRINARTGKRWSLDELREIWNGIQNASKAQAENWDWQDIFEENEDYASALYYH
jgi:hypothetical protein